MPYLRLANGHGSREWGLSRWKRCLGTRVEHALCPRVACVLRAAPEPVRCAQDTAPPVMAWRASAPLPPAATTQATAAFAWAAEDASPVSHECMARGAPAPGAPQGALRALTLAGASPSMALPLDAWAACAPPLVLYWLLPGAPSTS